MRGVEGTRFRQKEFDFYDTKKDTVHKLGLLNFSICLLETKSKYLFNSAPNCPLKRTKKFILRIQSHITLVLCLRLQVHLRSCVCQEDYVKVKGLMFTVYTFGSFQYIFCLQKGKNKMKYSTFYMSYEDWGRFFVI